MGRFNSAVAEDCVTVTEKALRGRLGITVDRAEISDRTVEFTFAASKDQLGEVSASLFKELVRAACGSEQGTTKVGAVDVLVDSRRELQPVRFVDVVRVHNFRFEELPDDSSAITAVAEATYFRYLLKHSDAQAYAVTEFPKCLTTKGGLRRDVVIAGYVLFSLASDEDNVMKLRVYVNNIDEVLGSMCTSSFANTVLPKSWGELEQLEPNHVVDLLEDAQLAINDFWTDSAQDTRARSQTIFLMTTVGSGLREYFSKKTIAAGGIFSSSKGVTEMALSCCDDWVNMCHKLTTIDWGAVWGGHFEDPQLRIVRDRLRVVASLRDLVDEIMELLITSGEPQSLRRETLWEVMGNIDVFKTTPAVEEQWDAGLNAFYRRLEPIEHRCAAALRDFFGERGNLAPQTILNEVVKFRQLIRRHIVAKELVSEREALLAKLNDRLESIRLEFEHRAENTEDDSFLEEEDRRCQTGRFMPGVVNNMIWLRQLRGRVEEMINMCKSLLLDLQNAKEFVQAAATLLEEVSDYETELRKHWTMDVEDHSHTLMLDANAPLMEIDGNGRVEVNYPERLVQLIREVRIFRGLGLRISREIQKMVDQGVRFYRNGVLLKQIASTYNSMTNDIIPCTRAMLLEPALTFENIITASGDRQLTWRNKEDADRFIEKLSRASQSLTDDNRRLHRLHKEIEFIVVELFSVDLLRSRERWMGKVHVIREKMEASGFKNMEAWKLFWDAQLYKAMEYQYQLGLESLHEFVTEIKADIVYDQETGLAALRPSLEAIRGQYYQRIKDFMTFPLRFRGCGENFFFKEMPARNERGIVAVMQHAAQLFKKIQQELKRFNPLLVIGQCGKDGNPSLETIVGMALTEVQHWEQGIRLLKQKGKEINAEDLFIKCGCITLCTAGIKSTVEDHLYKLAEVLRVTLRRSAEKHLHRIEVYLDAVSESLDSKLTKMDEIGAANARHVYLAEQRPAMEVEFYHFYNKNVLLQSMSNHAGLEFANTRERWDGVMRRLDTYESELEEQMNRLRSVVEESAKTWQKKLERFANQWHELKPKTADSPNALPFVKERQEQWEALEAEGNECAQQCKYFQLEEPDMEPLHDLKRDIEEYALLWSMVGAFHEELTALQDEPWLVLQAKLYRFDDFVKVWHEKLKEIPTNLITVQIRTLLDSWSRCALLFKFVRGDGFTPGHWVELFHLLGTPNATQDTLKFGDILSCHEMIVKREMDLRELHSRAQGEAQIREALYDVRSWGTNATFTLCPHPERPGVMLITEWKDTLSALSDNRALLLSMKESPYFSIFASDANKWEERLACLDEYLRSMNQIQRKWVYLEPIFRRGALPQEQERFARIDKEYLQVMSAIAKDRRLVSLASHKEHKEVLRNVLEQLDRCQRALNQYLEAKRDSFPRFYFISDDDLLEILAQSRNPLVIQSHLKKLFMGIHSVRFDTQKEHILQIHSLEGETVPLEQPVHITDEVEEWLCKLDVEMKDTLRVQLVRCLEKLDIGTYPTQILCTAAMLDFTKKTEAAIREARAGGLAKHKANLQSQLRDLTVFAGSNSDVVMSLKLKSLIMDLIHNIEVVQTLIQNGVVKATDWLWRKQLRYYLDYENKCVLRMVDAEFKYSYEYQGNAPKLVHTPLTDRCYLTLTQGMQLGYGGNPYGPAGTGKTESVKALGNAMGRQVLVFNCDEGIDFKSMGRIFTGLVKCGAWGCFDEFNRLKVDQLSAVSQMIQVIQESLKNGESRCNLLGRDIDVDPNAGIFVTMNPAGKRYGGRSKLPDNLKQLFRSVAMSAPDNELIMETILFSEGFENATELAKRTVEIFKLAAGLLSQQQHYDWGLRAMKSVMRLGGSLIHQYLMDRVGGKLRPTPEEVLEKECEILIKSLRVNTLSKLTFDDAILFNNLVADVFPGVPIKEIDYADLHPAIVESVKELKLQLVESQVQKILQLYEALKQRMGVVLVGPGGSGKSTLLRVLRRALQRLGVSVPLYVMNPKAMPRTQLLGHMDNDTREWFDGVLTEAAKKVVKEENDVRSWIVCDGDVDPEWVESLNSVLDDNKLLTMPNGVRIQFGENVNFLFEAHSLAFASPATVSRMGIIYLSEEDVNPKTMVASWLLEQPEESRNELRGWIDEFFYRAINNLVATGNLIVETTRTGLVASGLSQLQHCSNKAQFTLALIYGLGSYLPEENRREYARDIHHMTGERALNVKNPLDICYDPQHGCYRSFEFQPAFDLTVEDLYRHPMIATVECQRNMEIMRAWTKPLRPGVYRPFILVGPEGCGKTMLLTNLFAGIVNTRVATVNCSAQTEGIHLIQKLKQTCQMFNTNQGRVLRPKDAERLVLLLKDMNLPKPDKYGTVQLHSLLQQIILYSGFYDTDLEWITVERVQIVGSMNPPGSMGRYPVAPRFLAIVSVLCMSYPSRESMQTIYTEFLNIMIQSHRLKFELPRKGASDIARIMTTVYEITATRCTVDMASHYIFSPRDVTTWALNLLNYNSVDIPDAIGYEGRRIFVDRLISPEERTKYAKLIYDNLLFLVGHRSGITEKETIYYVSWMDATASRVKKLFSTSMEDLRTSAGQMLLTYSREFTELDVQLIPEVCAWIARVDRVLSQERGNLLLVGRSGMCDRAIIRLVAYSLRMEVMTLSITREYGMKQFNAELKSVLCKVGIECQHVVLLLEDHHFSHNPLFLECVNSLLSSGEIPGLFTQEEQDALLGPLREEALGEGMSPYAYFVDRITRMLHVCVVMDPTNPNYELRCRSNPALFTHCNVYWMGTWYSDSLKLIPRLMMPDVYKALDSREDRKDFSLTTEIVHVHRGFAEKFSPQHFKILCLTYQRIFNEKSSAIAEGLARLHSGVSKLDEAKENVDQIATDVAEKKIQMEAKQREADEALQQIQANMEEAGDQKKNIQNIQKSLEKEQSAIEERKRVIEERLNSIQPTLDAALSSVRTIRPEHLSELKSMKQPPAVVQDVLEGVVILIAGNSVPEINWAAIRKVLAGDIKNDILNLDLNNVNEMSRGKLERFIQVHENSFRRDVIGRASKAAAPMAEWLKAVVEYSKVLQTVAPMRDELQGYEANLRSGNEKKKKYEVKLSRVEEHVEELKKSFGEKTTEAERLKESLEQAERLYQSAHDLLSKLANEHARWATQSKAIQADQYLLPKRCLLAAAFVLYLGNEAEDVRRRTLDGWKERIGQLEDFNFFTFLRPESMQLRYKAEGLPGDELSMDNAVIMQEQVTTPLIIDSSDQAVSWLLSNLKGRGITVDVCSVSDEHLVSALELALRFGKSFVITDVDHIDSFMYPLFRRELRTEGSKRVIQIGDRRTVDYSDGFQLYLVTPSTDLRIPPDVLSYLTPINFSITLSGLEGQFLGTTIQHEQPELEKEKLEVLQKEEKLKLQLSSLEEALLNDLANSKGSLLENKTLIDSLNEIKTQAAEISEALEKSKAVQEEIDTKRNVYRPFATTSSQAFFIVKSLKGLSHMYQFSFNFFMGIFRETLQRHAEDHTDADTKIKALTTTFVRLVVYSVSISLLKEHRPIFGIYLARSLHPEECTPAEWDFFLDRAIAPEAEKKEVQIPSWVLPDSRDLFRSFVVLFRDLVPKMNLHEADVWLQWMRSTTPETAYPDFLMKLTQFQRLLVVKTLRGDRLIAAVSRVACKLLSVKSWGDNRTLASFIRRTEASTPVLLITTAGADPSQSLQDLAYHQVGRERFHQIAMGGGQTDEAIRLLRVCAEKGDWLFLKNLHLVIPWVSVLQKEFNLLTPDPGFRLFLTSESHDEFPSILLSQSLKITLEAPPGVQQNLLHTYKEWEGVALELKETHQKELLFITASFHAIVQERLSYVPQGWSKVYEVTPADLKSAADIVLQQTKAEIDWRAIRGILENAIYGARMESEFDLRILQEYTRHFFDPAVLAGAKQQRSLFATLRVPGTGNHVDYVQAISGLPESDVPSLFSLPPNADRVVQLSKVRQLTDDLQHLNEMKASSSFSREEWTSQLMPVLQAWAELTQPHSNLLTLSAMEPAEATPIVGFLTAEMASSLRLVSLVDESIGDLRKVAEGTALLKEDRRAEAAAMIAGEVPSHWDGYFHGSPRILPWLQSLLRRATTIVQWRQWR
ncbi:cytoplasmic dynein 2 heavy chain 1 isoform X1 [Trypanosoma rangeli]|uniref:Cytoplasmic dynein 2 heavy chain 1 n=1 Tax=Trypanosoma rangeli TaxID=5698 RepID=A0A3R7L7V2_TRYRA|nr:cytoplasmic dynein 2 heavy chain 1 isoform X1 [Trypanosoma rangeli]RNF09395.1 cytoplasmic dynein 2 heavy chain 1 isoform X1 [Trypanosoma rangeli]|eukprot:RNF09395.1 cytoplasmic dynein 2 heavy chain 1 isoform X1 [Trypanosoma rangeli]